MRPLSDHLPKPLLEVRGRALIEHVIDRLRNAGIRDLVINHAWLGAHIVEHLGDGARLGVRIAYSPEPPDALETGGGILNALPLLGDDPFIVCNADVWCDFDFRRLHLSGTDLCHLVLVPNPPQHPRGDFHLDGGRVLANGEPRLTFAGIGLYRSELFHDRSPGRFPLPPLLTAAMAQGRVSGQSHLGDWDDVGTPERLDALRRRLDTADPAPTG